MGGGVSLWTELRSHAAATNGDSDDRAALSEMSSYLVLRISLAISVGQGGVNVSPNQGKPRRLRPGNDRFVRRRPRRRRRCPSSGSPGPVAATRAAPAISA